MADIGNPFNPMRFTGHNGLLTVEEASRLQDLIKTQAATFIRNVNQVLEQFNVTITTAGTTPGPAGSQGLPGIDGADGAEGPEGRPGRDGRDGAPGPAGLAGADGQDGQDGIDGRPGRDGASGAAGLSGSDGADGSDGWDGMPGAVGQQGRDGRPGLDGADGQDAFDAMVPRDQMGLPLGALPAEYTTTGDVATVLNGDSRIRSNYTRVCVGPYVINDPAVLAIEDNAVLGVF